MSSSASSPQRSSEPPRAHHGVLVCTCRYSWDQGTTWDKLSFFNNPLEQVRARERTRKQRRGCGRTLAKKLVGANFGEEGGGELCRRRGWGANFGKEEGGGELWQRRGWGANFGKEGGGGEMRAAFSAPSTCLTPIRPRSFVPRPSLVARGVAHCVARGVARGSSCGPAG